MRYKKIIFIMVMVVTIGGILGGYQYYSYISQPIVVSYDQYKDDLFNERIDMIFFDSSEKTMKYTLWNDKTKKMSSEERYNYHYKKSEYRKVDFNNIDIDFGNTVLKHGVYYFCRPPKG